jgi:Tol biopolymer transport system component
MRSRRFFSVFTGLALVGLTLALPTESQQAQTQRIVFESNRTGNSDVWIADANGLKQRNLTRGSTTDDVSPALSPNGRLILYARVRGERSELWLMNADGSGKRRLGIPKGSESNPAWSPSSLRIALVRLLGLRWDVVVTDLNGIRRALTSDAAAQYDVSWSPQGERIVFDQVEKGTSDLWTVPAAGGTPTRITNTPRVAELNPAWSPVAGEIAYDASVANGPYDLYVLDLTTRTTRRVTRDAADDADPAWSPSGTMLAYRHEVGGDYEIAKVEAAGGGKPRNVSHDPNGLDLSPSWQLSTSALLGRRAIRSAATSSLWTFACDAAYPGTAGMDFYVGDAQSNHMCGGGQSDKVYGCGSPYGWADFLKGGSGTDYLRGWAKVAGTCTTGDRRDWLRSRYTQADHDYVYGGGDYDRALIDAVDQLAGIEKVDP